MELHLSFVFRDNSAPTLVQPKPGGKNLCFAAVAFILFYFFCYEIKCGISSSGISVVFVPYFGLPGLSDFFKIVNRNAVVCSPYIWLLYCIIKKHAGGFQQCVNERVWWWHSHSDTFLDNKDILWSLMGWWWWWWWWWMMETESPSVFGLRMCASTHKYTHIQVTVWHLS